MNKTIVNPLIKDEVTFIKSAAENDGKITEIDVVLMPGGGTPIHYHTDFSESFLVIEGTLGITLENKTIYLKKGENIKVEKMKNHRFFNDSAEKVVFKTIIEPGSVGFENSLKILYGLAADGFTNKKGIPTSLVQMAVISKMSNMYLPGVFKLLSPLFNYLAKKGIKKGIDHQLINKYCAN